MMRADNLDNAYNDGTFLASMALAHARMARFCASEKRRVAELKSVWVRKLCDVVRYNQYGTPTQSTYLQVGPRVCRSVSHHPLLWIYHKVCQQSSYRYRNSTDALASSVASPKSGMLLESSASFGSSPLPLPLIGTAPRLSPSAEAC